MEKAVLSLDLDKNIGMVTLSDGTTKLAIPKLSISRLIKVVKFVGIDGAKLYKKFQDIIRDPDTDDLEKIVIILEELSEEQLIHIFSILLDLSDEEALKLDHNEMLEIIVVYVDTLDLNKTFLSIRTLSKKVLNKELPPTLGEWLSSLMKKRTAGADS